MNEPKKGQPLSLPKTVGFVIVCAILISISLIMMRIKVEVEVDGPEKYLGVWQDGNITLEIEAKPDKEVDETIQFHKMTCTLLLPVRLRSLSGPSQEMYVKEGIYNCGEGQDAIIVFCNHCGGHVLMGIRRNGKELQFGCSRKAYCFELVNYVFLLGHNTYVKFEHYQWVTFKPVEPKKP